MSGRSTRAFKRAAYIGVRMPEHQKERLEAAAKKEHRDPANLALHAIISHLDAKEREAEQEQRPAAHSAGGEHHAGRQ